MLLNRSIIIVLVQVWVVMFHCSLNCILMIGNHCGEDVIEGVNNGWGEVLNRVLRILLIFEFDPIIRVGMRGG